MSLSRERRERPSPFSVLPSRSGRPPPPYLSSASCFAALVPAKDPTLQYVFIQGTRRAERSGADASGVGREPRGVKRTSAERSGYTRRGSGVREKGLSAEKKREEFRGTCSVIIAEVATPPSLTARPTAKSSQLLTNVLDPLTKKGRREEAERKREGTGRRGGAEKGKKG